MEQLQHIYRTVQKGVQPLVNELRHLITEIQATRQAGSRLKTRLAQGLTFTIHGSLGFTPSLPRAAHLRQVQVSW